MEHQKHTSLKDMARILGVSIPTVSRALKDSPEISRELCARAKQLAREMNYRPNPFAMSLRKNTPRIIGVVVPEIVTHFFSSILSGVGTRHHSEAVAPKRSGKVVQLHRG